MNWKKSALVWSLLLLGVIAVGTATTGCSTPVEAAHLDVVYYALPG